MLYQTCFKIICISSTSLGIHLNFFSNFRSSFEGFFASKGAAFAIPDGDFVRKASSHGGNTM